MKKENKAQIKKLHISDVKIYLSKLDRYTCDAEINEEDDSDIFLTT